MTQQIETALALRLEASLRRFERQMQQATRIGEDSAVKIQRGFDRTNRGIARSAEQSAQAMGRELERLRAKYDPMFAASQRYERELGELNQAHKLGALSAFQYEAALESLNAEFARQSAPSGGAMAQGAAAAAAGTVALTGAAGGLGAALGRNAPIIQQASFQVQDFAMQVAAGTSVTQAFAQQAPQLFGAIGGMGTRLAMVAGVLGVVVAIGVPLIAMLMNSGEAAQTMEERLDRLRQAVDAYREAVRDARLPTAELAERYGTATAAARDFLAALEQINDTQAMEQLQGSIRAITDGFGDRSFVQGLMATFAEASGALVNPLEQGAQRIRDEFEITIQSARELRDAVAAVGEASTPQEVVDRARALLAFLEATIGPYQTMNAEARGLYERTRQAGEEAARLIGATNGAESALGGAASQAAQLANELARAVGNARALAQQGIDSVERARIEYEFRDNPVGRARALAGLEYDSRIAAPPGTDSTVLAVIEQNRRTYVEAAAAVAQYNEQVRIAQQNDRSTRSGGGVSSEPSGLAQFLTFSDDQLARAERALAMVGKTNAEIAEATAREELLREARERGLDVDLRRLETGRTLREEIDAQAAAIGNLVAAQEQANAQTEFFNDLQGELKDGFLDAIVAGKDFEGVMRDVARAIARAALEAAIFGSGPLAGLFGRGGGGKSGFGGGIFGFIRSLLSFDGGGFTGGGPRVGGLDGKGGFPAILHPNETVIDHTRGGSTGGGSVTINVNVSGASGDRHIIDLVSQGVTAGLRASDAALPGRVRQIVANPRRA